MCSIIETIPPENFLSPRFRVHPVMGDAMEPTFRGGRDYALLAPVTSYRGEGIYLVNIGAGVDLFRVCSAFDGKGGLRLSQENPRCETLSVSLEHFDDVVIAIVIADIRPRDERFLRQS
ncbi:S24 family peptidase [Rhizobium sp. Root1220]|uniref:S24 family peptidase n=1 Tax=Rhizobium sp. Root1220 TaxID=1736432 RepID=UPI0006FD3438|nr:S24 family peptidase [Rhizobium sp. Root1220]KQV83273.1 hypothetical protein ASC90_22030 [Rhizobium sp. Root1220]